MSKLIDKAIVEIDSEENELWIKDITGPIPLWARASGGFIWQNHISVYRKHPDVFERSPYIRLCDRIGQMLARQ